MARRKKKEIRCRSTAEKYCKDGKSGGISNDTQRGTRKHPPVRLTCGLNSLFIVNGNVQS